MFTGAQNVGVNPKINNMQNAYDKAQYPLFLISDAGIRSKLYTISAVIYRAKGKPIESDCLFGDILTCVLGLVGLGF